MEKQKQCEQLETFNSSILVLLLLIAGILLSFSATVDQRNELARILCGGEENPSNILSKRRLASILIVGTTGFFAWAACRGMSSAQPSNCSERRSAQANLFAAVLVFVAALIRLNDLNLVIREQLNAASAEFVEPQ